MQSTIEQQSEVQLLTIKAKYGEELRRFSVPCNVNWQQIISKISGLFSVQPDSILVKYEDDEKEMITIDSDGELQEAIRVYHQVSNSSGILCLRLIITDAPAIKKSVSQIITRPECEKKRNNWERRRGGFESRECWRRKDRGPNKSCSNINREELRAKLLQLEEMGFKCKMRNVHLLKMHDGDVNKVCQFLLEKQQKRQSLKDSLEQLTQQGFNKQGINIFLLRKYEGNVEKVLKILKASKELEEKGYENTLINVKLLIRFDGDVQKAEEIWQKKREKFMQKREKDVDKKLEKDAWKTKKCEKKQWKKERNHQWKQGKGEWKHGKGDWKKHNKWGREFSDDKEDKKN